MITKSDGSSTTHNVAFMYDENGEAFGIDINGKEYFYVKNAQNDVIAIVNSNNETVVLYQYDSWGKLLSCEDTSENDIVSFINPYTYRGYYYDSDTEMYFLKSRYYNPELCRFISADSVDVLDEDQDNVLENNLFAYCLNNPINMVDDDGELASRIIGGIVGGATGVVLGIILANRLGLSGWKKAALIAAAGIGGAALGAFLGPYVAKLGSSVATRLGIKSIPKMGSQIGRLGKLVKNTKPVIKGYTKHGVLRITQRGITKSMVRNIVKSGYAISQSGGNTLFFTQSGVVVLNKAGKVVTAYSARFFDEAMKEIIRQFYGG